MQHCLIGGSICREDPTTKMTKNGTELCTFTVALQGGYGKYKRVDYVNCVAYGKTAQNIPRFFHKHSYIILEGEFQNNPYSQTEKGYDIPNWQFVVNTFQFPPKSSNDTEENASANNNDDYVSGSVDDFADVEASSDLPF